MAPPPQGLALASPWQGGPDVSEVARVVVSSVTPRSAAESQLESHHVDSPIDILEDVTNSHGHNHNHNHNSPITPPHPPTNGRPSILGEIADNACNSPFTPKLSSITAELDRFHFRDTPTKHSPIKQDWQGLESLQILPRARRVRRTANTSGFDTLESVDEEVKEPSREPPATVDSRTSSAVVRAIAHVSDPPSAPQASSNSIRTSCYSATAAVATERDSKLAAHCDLQISKNFQGQFEWLISLPAPASPAESSDPLDAQAPAQPRGKKLYYGCNYLHRISRAETGYRADTVRMIATALEGDDEQMKEEPKVLVDDMMAVAQPFMHHPSSAKMTEPEVVEFKPHHQNGHASPSATLDHSGMTFELTPSRTVSSSMSRIEDSVEALDDLEDAIEEALSAATPVGRSVPPAATKPASVSTTPAAKPHSPALNRTSSTNTRPASTSHVRMRSTETSRAKRTSVIHTKDGGLANSDNSTATTSAPPKRAPVPRPASLAPPKPPAKSTRVLTRSTYELPGEAIARRLKEQKEARLQQQYNADKSAPVAAVVAPSPRPKSTRAPTIPNFELPGEAISRRKREERDAKLRAQEEEERKRREFKAKPIRTSIAPSTLPRETISSRARQTKYAQEENASRSDTVANKRLSTVGRATLSATAAGKTPEKRGRDAGASRTDLSRATSTSTGSISGKRSTISAEDAHLQKLQGKEIFKRDNSLTAERERERRERENLAAAARAEAAERSRLASREWSEKQRLKRLASTQSSFASAASSEQS